MTCSTDDPVTFHFISPRGEDCNPSTILIVQLSQGIKFPIKSEVEKKNTFQVKDEKKKIFSQIVCDWTEIKTMRSCETFSFIQVIYVF